MRWIFFLCIVCGCLVVPATETNLAQRPIPPGVRQADKISNAPIEPPAKLSRPKTGPEALKEEAEEIARLSANLPAQINLVSQGQLPKELAEQLKRIEKLAKHLRLEISR